MRERVHLAALAARAPVPPAVEAPVTSALHDRLTAEDHAALAAALEGDALTLWRDAAPQLRPWLTLQLAVHYGLPGALEHTGLPAALPPEEVHAMARGPLAAAGDIASADAVVAAWEAAGVLPGAGAAFLDFGCSSGRLTRVLGAWRPDLALSGCDPNAGAVAWAQAHLDGSYFASATSPPLELDAGSIDAAVAISIWSHFDAAPARAWLDELRRVVRVGGTLTLTTHGLDAVRSLHDLGVLRTDVAVAAVDDTLRHGFRFVDVFGSGGDHGVSAEGWGDAFLTGEWLLAQVTPGWAVRLYRPGAIERTQDLWVLQRTV